jgi:hypothetical protein
MQSHADVDRNVTRPGFQQKGLLGGAGSTYSVCGAGENGEDTVSFPSRAYNGATISLNGGRDEGIMPGHDVSHFKRVLLPEQGASLYIGEEVGNQASGKLRLR